MSEPTFDFARLRVVRELLGWSQKELGKRCGVSRTVISNLEGGKSGQPLLYKVVLALNAEIDRRRAKLPSFSMQKISYAELGLNRPPNAPGVSEECGSETELTESPYDGVSGYLIAFRKAMCSVPFTPPRWNAHFFSELLMQLRVSTQRRGIDQMALASRRHGRQLVQWLADESDEVLGSAHPADDCLFSRQAPHQRPIVWWDEEHPDSSARRRFQWAVVLGDPGIGKTTLLKYEGWLSAGEQLQALNEGRINIAQVVFPVFVRLPDLAEAVEKSRQSDSDISPDMVETFARLVTNASSGGVPVTAPCRALISKKLRLGEVVMLLDALDETPRENLETLFRWLQGWLEHYPPQRLYITSRVAGYRGLPRSFTTGERRGELELVAFAEEEIQRFIRGYFGELEEESSGRSLAEELWGQLRQNPAMLSLARTPLLLNLMCASLLLRGTTGSLAMPICRSQLFGQCLEGLLGRWPLARRTGVDPVLDPTEVQLVQGKLELLAELAWQLSGDNPEHTLFSLTEMVSALQTGSCRALLESLVWTETRAVEALSETDGVLTRAGAGVGSRYLFIHRNFQEYLIAWALGRRKDWLDEAMQHVYDPAWIEILSLLPGVLHQQDMEKDCRESQRALSFVRALLHKNCEDLLCRPLMLAGRAAGEVHMLPVKLKRGLADLFALVYFCPMDLSEFLDEGDNDQWILPVFSALLPQSAMALEALLDGQQAESDEWNSGVETLLRIDLERGQEYLRHRMNCEDDRGRSEIVVALADLPVSRKFLVERIHLALNDTAALVRLAAIDSIVKVADVFTEFVDDMTRAIGDPDGDVVRHAAELLWAQDSEAAERAFFFAFNQESDPGSKGWLIILLLEMEIPEDSMLRLLRRGLADCEPSVRAAALEVFDVRPGLGECFRGELLDSLSDEDADVAGLAALACVQLDWSAHTIDELESTELRDGRLQDLIDCLIEDSDATQSVFFWALVQRSMTDGAPHVRMAALDAISRQEQLPASLRPLLANATSDADPDVREFAKSIVQSASDRYVDDHPIVLPASINTVGYVDAPPPIQTSRVETLVEIGSKARDINELQEMRASLRHASASAQLLAAKRLLRQELIPIEWQDEWRDAQTAAIKTLERLLDNDDVCEDAARELMDYRPTRALFVFRRLLERVLGSTRPPSPSRVVTLAGRILRVAGELPEPRREAAQALLSVLRRKGVGGADIVAAARKLIDFDLATADILDALQGVLKDHFIPAADLVVRLGLATEETIREFEQALANRSLTVQIFAARTLRRLRSPHNRGVDPAIASMAAQQAHLQLGACIDELLNSEQGNRRDSR